ncbi:MAG TPA: zeta toxin family protein [Puia sp.]|jgi:predicted ABC-type ATPase|nr:zeta toxin family protein [Puia sp.]
MPTIFVIAGPNGIGKTTSFYDFLPNDIPVINSDEIAKEAKARELISSNTQEYSNREASRLIDEQIAKRHSFAIETNLSDLDTWKFLIKIRELGYELHLVYISTDEIKLLNDRISERVLLGDHYVRPDVVEERYIGGLKLLNHYFSHPDVLKLFDNSSVMTQVAEFRNGEIVTVAEKLPDWVNEYFGEFLKPNSDSKIAPRDLNDIDAVRRSYQAMKDEIPEKKRKQ